MGRTHANYARYFNLKRGRSGHLWEARFFPAPRSLHLWRAMAYVERNPVRAALVNEAADYPGRALHCTSAVRNKAGWISRRSENNTMEPNGSVLRTSVEDQAFSVRLLESTRRGRVMGSLAFADRLGKLCGARAASDGGGPAAKNRHSAARLAAQRNRCLNMLSRVYVVCFVRRLAGRFGLRSRSRPCRSAIAVVQRWSWR